MPGDLEPWHRKAKQAKRPTDHPRNSLAQGPTPLRSPAAPSSTAATTATATNHHPGLVSSSSARHRLVDALDQTGPPINLSRNDHVRP
ncbi:uncharacterized protein PSFLO_01514 [Pseudozyma flocculosa]|uniref:Uncharacterized protein n=1 Tax=Pseudozyma flocculosa TaxID=84751 RepID=A0A5C3EUV0_9BASI|nr:uncharacterized protein PSFLO_01514 [Pseudozyma flocculosa]